MQEWRKHRLTQSQVMEIVFAVYNSASKSVCKQVRKTCSYLYHLATGIPGKNWPELPGVVGSVKVQARALKNSVKPDHVVVKVFALKVEHWRGIVELFITKDFGDIQE